MRTFITLSSLLLFNFTLKSQSEVTFAEKLGYPKEAKVIILHVDDVGMSYDSKERTIQALEKGVSNSASVMMPCGWVPGFIYESSIFTVNMYPLREFLEYLSSYHSF